MKTVYTAIFGNYDEIKTPIVRKSKNWKYVCFTDQPFKSDIWEVRNVPIINNDPVKTARYYKIMFYKTVETEYSMWLDGTFIINVSLNRWWMDRYKEPFTAIKHPFDNCIYKDAEACIRGKKDNARLIERQVNLYKTLGIPRQNGLIASGILMRRKTTETINFCTTWWHQVEQWSNRDQIAYGYANWKYPGVVKLTNWNYTTQSEFIHVPHLHKSWRQQKLREIYDAHGIKI